MMIRLGFIGTGGMARNQAKNFQKIKGVKIVAACDINPDNLNGFCDMFGVENRYTDIDKMLKEVKLDAVTNVTSDRFHKETSLKAIKYGVHILCEKPLAENYKDAMQMVKAVKKKGVINMVNLSYRNSWALHKAHEMISKGAIGEVRHFHAEYLQSWLVSKQWGLWNKESRWLWRLSSQHGSKGVLGDVGVHIVDFLTYPAGNIKRLNCQLKTFKKAKNNKIGEYPLDANDSCIMNAELENGAIGTIF